MSRQEFSGVLPARLASLLGHGVSAALAERLLATASLQPQLGALMATRLGNPGPLDPAQSCALGMDTPALHRLALQAGAVWHGAAIAALLDGPQVRALVSVIGPELRRLALAGQEFAEPIRAAGATAEAIAAAIPHAGTACLTAWIDAQPAFVAARLALRMPDIAASAAYRGHPAIIGWLLERPELPA